MRTDVDAGEGVAVDLHVHGPAGERTPSEGAVVADLHRRARELDVEHLRGDELANVARPGRSPGERRDAGVQVVTSPQQGGQLVQRLGHETDSSRWALAAPVIRR